MFDRAWPGAIAETLQRIEFYGQPLVDIVHRQPPDPRWDQDWFPTLDAAAAYAIIRDTAPETVLEIGSGHSTRFIARAMADGGLTGRIVCIDPAPRADLTGLDVDFIGQPLQHIADDALPRLGAGDVLFVDSSHLALPGSDVDHIMRRILPRLAPGALVHFHDVFLPDPYPEDWAWRGYNEQVVLVPLLHFGGFEVIFASWYVHTRKSEASRQGVLGRLGQAPGARPSSLWLRRCPAQVDGASQ